MDLVEEFLANEWPTYALAELDREDDDEAGGVDRLDRRTAILAKGNRPLKDRAQKLLSAWLQKKDNQTHSMCGKLRLRRALILKDMGDYHAALAEAERLLEADPKSAALNCLVGNLYGYLETKEDNKTAVSYFHKAIRLNDNWSEPRLELLDKLFLLGLDDKQHWHQIVNLARNRLDGADMTDRERLILWTYRAVAGVLLDSTYINSEPYAKERREAGKTTIDPDQREDWRVRDVYGAARQHLSGDDSVKQAARKELRDFLGETHSKLMPPQVKWDDEISRWEDR